MSAHKNARTTPHGRAVMVRADRGRLDRAAAAAAFAISERTVRKWLARSGPRAMRACRTVEPGPRVANRLAEAWVGMVLRLRREYRLTAAEIADKLQLARSTVAGHLAAAGLGRLGGLEPSEPVRRYQRQRPGELVHLDVKKLARFRRTGHRITGDRRSLGRQPAGSSSTSPSMTPPGLPMSRSCPTSGARAAPASSSAPCAGSRDAASASSGS